MTHFESFRDAVFRLTDGGVSMGHELSEVVAKVAAALTPHEMQLAGEQLWLDTSMRQVFVGNLSIVTLRYGSEVVVRPAPATGFVMLQFVLSGSIKVEHDGYTTYGEAGQGLIIESLDKRVLHWSKDCEQLILPLPRSMISQAIETLTGRPAPVRFDFDRVVHLDTPEGGTLTTLVEYILSMAVSDMSVSSPTASLAVQLLGHHLLQNHRASSASGPRTSAAPSHVIRAEKYMKANIAETIDLNQLADHVNVSTRTLCASFRRFRSASPMEWLRNYRLDVVRAWLQSGQATTIAHAAACAGFNHAGRFAQIYRLRFGESPNETLAALNY